MGKSKLEEEAEKHLLGQEIPDPPSRYEFEGVRVHEVLGPKNEPLLLAFGLVSFKRMLKVVNAYHAQAPQEAGLDPQPWDDEDADKIVSALNRLEFRRVRVVLHGDEGENPFTIQWETQGTTPVTIWRFDG